MTHVDATLVFEQRAAALLQDLASALAWIRDNNCIPLDAGSLRCASELESIAALVVQRRFIWSRADTGEMGSVDVADMPEELVFPLRGYLGELCGFDLSLPFDRQTSVEPVRQHGFVLLALPECLECYLA